MQGSMSGVMGQDPAEAAAINPFDPIALNNLAVVEASRGRYQQAQSLLQRAVKLAPARADIAANLVSLQRWLAQAEGQTALGLTPQPLQLPYQESGVPEVPPLWSTPVVPRPAASLAPGAAPSRPAAANPPAPVRALQPPPVVNR
jgi:tetratricopeptide (TPR) repeat protein